MSAGAEPGCAWTACLDDLADHLRTQRALLAAGSAALVEEFVPPPGLGPLPLVLLPRVQQLRDESKELVEVLREARDRVGAALAECQRPVTHERPAFVDSRA